MLILVLAETVDIGGRFQVLEPKFERYSPHFAIPRFSKLIHFLIAVCHSITPNVCVPNENWRATDGSNE